MGSDHLRGRGNWQSSGGAKAANAEKDFHAVFDSAFQGTDFIIRAKPGEFRNIYTNVSLAPEVLKEIYSPPGAIERHGISPDYAIDNRATRKTLYVEVKRQDGWVEGGKRADGRGNAHERSCKYFTPGLLGVLRRQGGLGESALPFWTVFLGDITRDPCRVREISLWYSGFEDHFFLWRDTKDDRPLLNHFNSKLRRLLA